MSMMKKTVILMAIVFGLSINSIAWDEVTHAYMTNMIPELIQDQELKKILQENRSKFIYGCWYSDTYQYPSGSRIDAFNPHIIDVHDKAFLNYLQKEDVRQQENYHKLVALFLGSMAHISEDLWYDNNLNPYQREKSDLYKGDSKHGAFVARQYGYMGIKVKRYFPKEDLYRLYKEAGLLEEHTDTPEKFESTVNDWSNNQYMMLRALKFLNFLSGNMLYNTSPWTAANLREAPGGMLNSAEVAAKLVEATWHRINNKPVDDILHAQYLWTVQNPAFLFPNLKASDKMTSETTYALNQDGDTIRGEVISKWEHEMVKRFIPEKAFEEGEKYTLVIEDITVNADQEQQAYTYDFKADFDHAMDQRLAGKHPWYKTMGMGFFGLTLATGIALLLMGLGGLIRMVWNIRKGENKVPLFLNVVSKLFVLAGLVSFGFGIYLLVSQGWMIVEMAI